MPGIIDLLPLLDGWSYKNYEYDVLTGQPVIVVKPGAEKLLIEEKKTSGYLLIANLQFTSPFGRMHIVARTPKSSAEFDFGVSPLELLTPNLTRPGNIQFWLGNPQMVLNHGRLAVAAAAQPLTTVAVAVWPEYPVMLHAPTSNVGSIIVGNTSASTVAATATTLAPGDSITAKNVGLLSHIWAIGTAGDFLEYAHEVPDTINNETPFGLNLTPTFPLPYADGFILKAENPQVLPISNIPGIVSGAQNSINMSVQYYNAVFIKIDDKKAFSDSLANLSAILR